MSNEGIAPPKAPRGPPHGWRGVWLPLLLWALVSAGSVFLLAEAQGRFRHDSEQRFALRAKIASRFVTTYLGDLTSRQSSQATRELTGPAVSQSDFSAAAKDSGFAAGLLLDHDGRVLQAVPADPELVGKDLSGKYAHLRSAVAGHVAISKVVPSAVEGVPVVAFAVPFDTPSGRRVFSGAYDIGSTPAGAYLRNAIPIANSRLYLLDSAGTVIAKNGPRLNGVRSLADLEPALAHGVDASLEGSFRSSGRDQRYASAVIAGTPWRVVVTAPAAAVYQVNGGATRRLPWVALFGFILVSLFAVLVFLRYLRGRADLARLVTLLEKVIRVDPLTELYNRRGLDEHLERATSQARRRESPLTVMLIDVDHFKRANDTWGHQAGDVILAELAGLMQHALRTEDVLGRWGGEEFLAILPDTGADAAIGLADRLRTMIAAQETLLPDGSFASVTVSIGLSTSVDLATSKRIGLADRALYAAKAGGRNRVEARHGQPAAAA